MRKISLFLTIIFFSVAIVPAQTPTPIPATDDKDVVKISTTLIQIDAVVTDKKGKVVTNLKPEDFEIYANGKKQDITNFSFVSTDSKTTFSETPDSKSNGKKVSVPLPPVKLKPEQVRRVYAVVVDDSTLSFASKYFVKQSLKKFIKEQVQDGDLVAILRTSGGIGALQSFTSNKQQLLAAVNKIRWTIDSNRISTFDPLTSIRGSDKAQDVEKYEKTDDFLEEVRSFRESTASTGTLGALRNIINGMRDLSGRKSVILLSEGFNMYRANRTLDPEILQRISLLTELANRESVTFYPVDPRGLDEPIIEAGDDTSDLQFKGNNGVTSTTKIVNDRANIFRNTQDSLRYIAEQTGGFAYYNQNDINIGIQRALNDQNGYYLLGYQPDEDTFDPQSNKFNKLVVKIKNPDLQIRYRSGFFGVTDEKIRQIKITPQQQLKAALTSPFGASEVNLDLYSISVNDEKNKDFIRSFVYIDTKNLTTTETPNGTYQGNYELVAIAYGDNGTIVDWAMKSYKFQFDKKFYQQFLDKGLIYDLTLPLKKAGAYQLRIAVRDTGSGKIGSVSQFVEVPDIGKKNLTVSNLIVKNYSLADWKKVSANQFSSSENANFFRDTTLRQFRRGTMLGYSYIIYNAKPDSIQNRQLKIQTKLFYNGKMLLQSEPKPYIAQGQMNPQRLEIFDAITLGTDLKSGEYALQIIVSENDKKLSAQSIDFEIVE